jgi:MFS family permease
MKDHNFTAETPRLWTKDYILFIISNTFLFLGESLLLPVIPYYTKEMGANDAMVGVICAVFFFTSIFMRIFTGRATARLGKKTLLILSLTVFALAMLGYYFSATLLVVLIIRLFQGLGFGSSSTLFSTMTAGVIPNSRMGEGMGYFGLGVSLSYALGPCLGAFAISFVNYKWIFLAAAAMELAALLMSLLIRVDNTRVFVERKGAKEFLSDFVEPKVFAEASMVLLMSLSTGAVFTYVVLFAKQQNIANVSLYFLLTSCSEILVRLFSGKLFDRKGLYLTILPGAIAGILFSLILSHAGNMVLFCVSALTCGITFGMILPASEASAMLQVSHERRIAANATVYNFMDIGTGLGPLLFGLVSQFLGYSHSFQLFSLPFVALLGMTVFLGVKRKSSAAIGKSPPPSKSDS